MLTRSRFAVACLLVCAAQAVLDTDKVGAYQRHLFESRHEHLVEKTTSDPIARPIADKGHLGVEPSALEKGHSNQILKAQAFQPSLQKPAEQQTTTTESQVVKPEKRDPKAMCSEFLNDSSVYSQCIQFYEEQNKQIDQGLFDEFTGQPAQPDPTESPQSTSPTTT